MSLYKYFFRGGSSLATEVMIIWSTEISFWIFLILSMNRLRVIRILGCALLSRCRISWAEYNGLNAVNIAPSDCAAKNVTINCGQFGRMTTMRSPFCMPSSWKTCASLLTSSSISRYVFILPLKKVIAKGNIYYVKVLGETIWNHFRNN